MPKFCCVSWAHVPSAGSGKWTPVLRLGEEASLSGTFIFECFLLFLSSPTELWLVILRFPPSHPTPSSLSFGLVGWHWYGRKNGHSKGYGRTMLYPCVRGFCACVSVSVVGQRPARVLYVMVRRPLEPEASLCSVCYGQATDWAGGQLLCVVSDHWCRVRLVRRPLGPEASLYLWSATAGPAAHLCYHRLFLKAPFY